MKSTNTIHSFATNLATARKYAGLSLSDLAERIEVSKQTISKYENGDLNPSMKKVYALAEALNVEVEDFFKEPNEEAFFMRQFDIQDISFRSFQEVKFREGEGIPTDLIERVKQTAMKVFLSYDELLKVANYQIRFNNPIRKMEIRTKYDAEQAAVKVRKAWKLGNNPLSSVISILENQGIRVIEVFEPIDFEGLSARIQNTPVIIINGEIQEITRRRFTALHELGHLILEIDESSLTYDEVERICDSFAGAMLMPKDLLFIELGDHRTKISKMELVTLKEKYGISVKAILVSAAFAKILTWDDYHELKFGLEFDHDLGKFFGDEKPRKFYQILLRALLEGKISRGKASELSGWTKSKVKEFAENYV